MSLDVGPTAHSLLTTEPSGMEASAPKGPNYLYSLLNGMTRRQCGRNSYTRRWNSGERGERKAPAVSRGAPYATGKRRNPGAPR